MYASAPTHGELGHSIRAIPFHCCGLTASNAIRGSPVTSVETGRTTEHEHASFSETRLGSRASSYIFRIPDRRGGSRLGSNRSRHDADSRSGE